MDKMKVMADEIFNWCCQNRECRALNIIDKKKYFDAIAAKRNVILVCSNCGVTSKPPSLTDNPTNLLKCIPFENGISSFPVGRDPEGWRDGNGKSWSRKDYLDRYGIDPQIFFDWTKNGKPKPAKQC
jgi:hypothetical protein